MTKVTIVVIQNNFVSCGNWHLLNSGQPDALLVSLYDRLISNILLCVLRSSGSISYTDLFLTICNTDVRFY